VGVGVIGVGLMGRRHAENLARHVGDARVLAVTDADESTRERVAKDLGTTASASVDALLDLPALRAVVIASPARFHELHAIAAARAGKDVFVEKPIAKTLEGADRVIAAARAAGVRLQVGFQRRYDPAYAEARKLVSSGALGRPRPRRRTRPRRPPGRARWGARPEPTPHIPARLSSCQPKAYGQRWTRAAAEE